MENLRLVGNEDNKLILANEAGQRFALSLDETLRAEIRAALRSVEIKSAPSKIRPREIQSQIRAGLSAQEVSDLLEIPLEDVARFEGPILAERQHMVNQALSIPVLSSPEIDPDINSSFGSAIRLKLEELGASKEQWNSWKDDNGWTIQLEFIVNEIHHDARWHFEPRHSALTARNNDAKKLSKAGTGVEPLIPKLRALENTQIVDTEQNRFDSDAFGPRHLELAPEPKTPSEAQFITAPLPEKSDPAVNEAAIKRAPNNSAQSSANTADLLDALRKRRGQRQSSPSTNEPEAYTPPVSLFETISGASESNAEDNSTEAEQSDTSSTKKRNNRPSLPSWDEIVFGAKSDNPDN